MLEINLFGRLRIRHVPCARGATLTGSLADLFAYLVLHRNRTFERDILAGMFWGDCDEKRAHGNLNSTLWRLRQLLEPESQTKGMYLLSARSSEVGFNPDGEFWLDVAAFEQRVSPILEKPASGVCSADISLLHDSLRLYHGDLIESCRHDWALFERERLRNLFLQTLALLMRHHEMEGEYVQSIGLGQQILKHDPCREEVHRNLMRLFAKTGQRQLAIRQYQRCREVLSDELDVTPMEETQILLTHILRSEQNTPPHDAESPVDLTNHMPDVASLSQQLVQAIQKLNEAKSELQAIEQSLEGIRMLLGEITTTDAPGDNAVIRR